MSQPSSNRASRSGALRLAATESDGPQPRLRRPAASATRNCPASKRRRSDNTDSISHADTLVDLTDSVGVLPEQNSLEVEPGTQPQDWDPQPADFLEALSSMPIHTWHPPHTLELGASLEDPLPPPPPAPPAEPPAPPAGPLAPPATHSSSATAQAQPPTPPEAWNPAPAPVRPVAPVDTTPLNIQAMAVQASDYLREGIYQHAFNANWDMVRTTCELALMEVFYNHY